MGQEEIRNELRAEAGAVETPADAPGGQYRSQERWRRRQHGLDRGLIFGVVQDCLQMIDVVLRWERPTDEVLRPRGTEPRTGAVACAANSPILTDTLSHPEGFAFLEISNPGLSM